MRHALVKVVAAAVKRLAAPPAQTNVELPHPPTWFGPTEAQENVEDRKFNPATWFGPEDPAENVQDIIPDDNWFGKR